MLGSGLLAGCAVALLGCGGDGFDREELLDRTRSALVAVPDDGGLALDAPLAICVVAVIDALPTDELQRQSERTRYTSSFEEVYLLGLDDCLEQADVPDADRTEALTTLADLIFTAGFTGDVPERETLLRFHELLPEPERPSGD